MEDLAPVLVSITLFVVTGGVILLRPISKRLGDLLEAIAIQKRRGEDADDGARLREVVAALESRLALLEERQNFTESLLANSNHRPRVEFALRKETGHRELLP
jgi:hypothetical protein